MRRKVGLFGGTFDPIHLGHVKIAETIHRQLQLDGIIFLPSGIPPHKTGLQLSDNLIRQKMVEAAIATYPFFSCSDFDLNRKTPSYTIETLRHFYHSALGRTADFFFIMGQDSLENLASWRYAAKLSQYAKLIVYPRSDDRFECPSFLGPEDLITVNAEILQVSSTQIRQMVRAGQDISQFVPEEVGKIIATFSLYR